MGYSSWSVVFGEVPAASKWNTLGINDSSFNDGTGIASLEVGGVTAVKNDYKFSVSLGSAQSSINGTTKVLLDTKIYDTGSNFDSVTNHRFVAPVAGFYQFNWSVEASGATSGTWITYLYKNGAQHKVGSYGGSATTFAGTVGSALVQLASSDYVEIFIQSTGSNAINNGVSLTRLEGFFVSNT